MTKKIAYLGPAATFTHEASIQYFGEKCQFIPARRISDIFSLLTDHQADYGVVPVENSTGGSITITLDLLIKTDLKIHDQVTMPIKHNLMANCAREEIKIIFSHAQTFIQCEQFLNQNFPQVKLVETLSNAEAAHQAAGTAHSAAIASSLCIKEYQLKLIKEAVNDNIHNQTKFFIISRNHQLQSKKKSLIIVSIIDKVGTLFDILKIFNSFKINMTKIESRPSKLKNWDYVFIIEYENPVYPRKNKKFIEKLKKKCHFVDYLGTY